jgi:agmatinase
MALNPSFNPSGIGLKNGHFIGLPFSEDEARVIMQPVPWDVTVSYRAGTSGAPQNILQASSQLDLYDADIPDAWKLGIYFREDPVHIKELSDTWRLPVEKYIESLEDGAEVNYDFLREVNKACGQMNSFVFDSCTRILAQGNMPVVVGGDHSTPLGMYQALAEFYPSYGILHMDAHMDLRNAYEGFTYSHASVFYNASFIPAIAQVCQVGIRDYCEEEMDFIQGNTGRFSLITDKFIKESLFNGITWHKLCQDIIRSLPHHVHISIDIDCFEQWLCPNTGTPVPGGLTLDAFYYLVKLCVESGRKIIGFDLVEVGGGAHEWDANVGARVLYKVANLAGRSRGWI